MLGSGSCTWTGDLVWLLCHWSVILSLVLLVGEVLLVLSFLSEGGEEVPSDVLLGWRGDQFLRSHLCKQHKYLKGRL